MVMSHTRIGLCSALALRREYLRAYDAVGKCGRREIFMACGPECISNIPIDDFHVTLRSIEVQVRSYPPVTHLAAFTPYTHEAALQYPSDLLQYPSWRREPRAQASTAVESSKVNDLLQNKVTSVL